MNGVPDRRKLVPPHLADSELLAHLDGEHTRAEAEHARAHLESCWSCRRRLSALEASIENYLDQRPALQPHLGADGEQRVRQFRERLARHAVESQPRLTERVRALPRSLLSSLHEHRRIATAALVAACLMVAMFTNVFGTRVSADTVLTRAQNVEPSQHAVSGQVKRVRIRVDRIQKKTHSVEALGTITTIEDPETSASYVKTESAASGQPQVALVNRRNDESTPGLGLLEQELPLPVAAYLHSQHWLPAATVEAFRQLTGDHEAPFTVRKEAGVFILDYSFPAQSPSGIAQAELRVNRDTYATMGLSLILGSPEDGTEYRFTPLSSTIETRTPEIARLFAPSDVKHDTHAPSGREPARIVPLTYAATQATDAEVRLNSALHKSEACLGEEIHVFPMSDGSLLVQGLVDQAERRDAIRKALLSADPKVPNQIFLPQELRSSSQLFALPYRSPDFSASRREATNVTGPDSGEHIPLYEQLFQHFSRPGVSQESVDEQINAFSNEAVTLSRQTFLHAWALKKLDLEFSSTRSSALSAESVQELERMRQDHRQKMASISRRQAEMLALAGISSPAVAAASSMPLDTNALLRLAQEQNDLVRSLFTVSSDASAATPNLSRLLIVLQRMGS